MSTRNSRHDHAQSASRSRIRRIRLHPLTVIGIVAVAACAPDRATAPADIRALPPSVRDVTPAATEQLLYQQPPVTGNQNSISAPQGNELASEFSVPAGERWRVTRIVVLGTAFNGTLGVSVY